MIDLIFQMQIQFTVGVILLLLLRPILAKFPKVVSYSLWCVLFLRLLCPFSLPIGQSLWPVQNMIQVVEQKLPDAEKLNENPVSMQDEEQIKNIPAKQENLETQNNTAGNNHTDTGNHLTAIPYKNILLLIWIAGMFFYLAYFLQSFHKFKAYAKMARECPGRKGVYESEHISTPYVFGIIRKKTLLPSHLEGTEKEYIICHEQMHIRRKDYLFKWIAFVLTGIYWFQPFVWIAAYFMEQDMEMSCDEAVIRKMGENIKKEYAQSLLSFAQGRKSSALPLTFASGSVKKRIRNVLHTTHLKVWMLPFIAVVILSLTLFVFTAQSSQRKVESQKTSLEEHVEKTPSEVENEYEYKADITHDGKEDTIIFDPTAIIDESKASGEEKTVVVKSGATGREIAAYTANTVHGGWNGIYVYTDDTGDYLINWKPTMSQGMGNYQLKVYSLKEDGTENILFEKTYQFDLNPGNFNFDGKSYQEYIDQVNQYLQKSYVIIDTDQGNAKYSTYASKIWGFYDDSEVIQAAWQHNPQ